MPIKLIIAALAIWRISVALWYENGPFDVYKSIRENIKKRGIPEMHQDPYGGIYLTHRYVWELVWSQLSCFWCVSFWVSLPISLLIIFPWYQWVALIPFALSGVAILLGGAGRTIWRASNE